MEQSHSEGVSEFETLMRENGPLVFTLAVRLSGNTADGQDLAQETFVKAYEHFSQFRGESLASTWLYRICINLWKNRVRYEKRRFFWRHFSLEGSNRQGDARPQEIPAADPPQGSAMERSFRQSLVQTAMKRLGSEERAILVLRDMEDRSYEDIAAILEIPLGTVKSRLARSREQLRSILEPHLRDI